MYNVIIIIIIIYKHVSAASCLPYRYIIYNIIIIGPTMLGGGPRGCTTFERARGSCNGAALWEIGRSKVAAAVAIINDKSADR